MSLADKWLLVITLLAVAFVTFVVIVVREGTTKRTRLVTECAAHNMVLVDEVCVSGFKP